MRCIIGRATTLNKQHGSQTAQIVQFIYRALVDTCVEAPDLRLRFGGKTETTGKPGYAACETTGFGCQIMSSRSGTIDGAD
jgi:hypothetical protein